MKLARILPIVLAAFVFLMVSAGQSTVTAAAPQGTPATRDWQTMGNGGKVYCADVDQAKGGVILGYIVPCIVYTVEHTSIDFSKAMIKWLTPVIYAFLTLVITFFGVRVLQGGGQLQSEGILLLLKVAIVIACLNLIPTFFMPSFYTIMDESQSIVAEAIGPDDANIHCDMAKYKGPNTPMIWAQMDCLVGKLWGLSTGGKTASGKDSPNMMLAASIFGLLGGFFFNGTFGATLFLALVGVLWGMLMIIIRTASGFLNAYFYGAVMFIIAPLFLPLVLLRQTASYFEPWWKGILASILMPIIITAYTMFAMTLYDKMLFADDSLLQNLFNNDLVKKIQALPEPLCSKQASGNVDARAPADGGPLSALYKNNPFMNNFAMPFFSGANDMCMGMTKPAFNNDKLKELLGDGDTKAFYKSNKEIFTKLFMDAVKLLVLSLLISTGYTNMQTLARLLVGSSATVSLLEPQGALEAKIGNFQGQMKYAFTKGIWGEEGADGKPTGGTVSGAAFLTRLTEVPRRMADSMKDVH